MKHEKLTEAVEFIRRAVLTWTTPEHPYVGAVLERLETLRKAVQAPSTPRESPDPGQSPVPGWGNRNVAGSGAALDI
jgi:hypothetical protein